MKSTVAIIDYGMGNLFSVREACQRAGLDAEITDDPIQCREAAGLVLPGVGAFGEAMTRLGRAGLDRAIHDYLALDRPFLAVCLGLQLLFERSEEFGSTSGLDVLSGRVTRFPTGPVSGPRWKVPAIGWLPAQQVPGGPRGAWSVPPLDGLAPDESLYFVHSYYVIPDADEAVLTRTSYAGLEYVSSLTWGQVFACQFHPERSGPAGLRIYRNFADSIRSVS